MAAASSDATDKNWLAIASSLRIVSLAAQGKNNAAREHINDLKSSSHDQWLQMLEQLQTVSTACPEATGKAIAQMQIHLINELTDQLVGVIPDFKTRWYLIEAEAYAYGPEI